MVRFWSDHFNIDISKGECKWLKPADDRNVIRPHALGKFPELLAASARSQAMLTYLDGRENRVRKPEDRPNENYARELLELHTLGVHGGYTQQVSDTHLTLPTPPVLLVLVVVSALIQRITLIPI